LREKITLELPKLKYSLFNGGRAPDSKTYIYARHAGDFIYRLALHKLLRVNELGKQMDHIIIDENGTLSSSAEGFNLARAPGQSEECKKQILSMIDAKELKIEIDRVKTSYLELVALTDKAKNEAEEKLLVGLIPGHCRICHKLGV
jgi:hypothetical protein